MLKNITMGQYYPVDSVVHRLDPRMKLILAILFIVAVFMAHSFVGYLLLLAFLIFACKMSNVPFRLLLKGLRPLRMIIIITFLLNLFFTPGEDLWVSFWIIRIYREGFMQALFYSLRLVFLVAGTSLLTLTTSPIAMTIALRFIPTLLEETDKIMKAQMARGADFESGNLMVRAKAMVPLLVPLFVSAFRRAGDLAMAMESRCYHGGEGRTRLRVLKTTKNDWLALLILLLLIAIIVLEGIFLKGVLF